MVFDARHKFCPSCGLPLIDRFQSSMVGTNWSKVYSAVYIVDCKNCIKSFGIEERGFLRE